MINSEILKKAEGQKRRKLSAKYGMKLKIVLEYKKWLYEGMRNDETAIGFMGTAGKRGRKYRGITNKRDKGDGYL